ncbi:MAG: toxin-antitoxin system HicB family antitoxin [Caldilinea sp. CFX5]|nr:toxin-antitoxin system HicB family antitoxin [Caldilinea sp. CFX5]
MTQPATYALRLPQSLKAAVAKVAKRDGTSINNFITVAIAEKLSAMETVSFFEERKNRADMDAFYRILTRQGGEPPRSGDEMPA